MEGALAGHDHPVHLADAAEELQEGAVGQAGGKAAVVLLNEEAGDIAAQGAPGMELVLLLGLGAVALLPGQPALEVRLEHLGFQLALQQQAVDAQQLVAKVAVINIALDGGQALGQWQWERNNSGGRHGARLYSSLQKARIILKKMQATYPLKIQEMRSKGKQPRFYVSFPLALAAAIGVEGGETVQWELLDRGELHLVRPNAPRPTTRRRASTNPS